MQQKYCKVPFISPSSVLLINTILGNSSVAIHLSDVFGRVNSYFFCGFFLAVPFSLFYKRVYSKIIKFMQEI